jgi:hypothetical protein
MPDWLFWMTPGERQWFWWESRVDTASTATVVIEVSGWPTAVGALRWLLEVAGASTVETLNAV